MTDGISVKGDDKMSRTPDRLSPAVRFAACLSVAFSIIFGVALGQKAKEFIFAPDGASYPISGRDILRRDDQLVIYAPEKYRKDPPNASGVDVYIVGGKVVEVRDRARAVHLEYKADPGPISVGKDGFVLSAHGAARRWVIAHLKVGDAVKFSSEAAASAASDAEISPAPELPCFPGAYYRKAVSSFDRWTGIIGIIRLGQPQTDPSRLDPKDGQPLDNFSVYMGGRAGEQEIDAGLTWSFSVDENGKRSAVRDAWHPFWRNERWAEAPAQREFYWRPGDVVAMAVLVAGPGKLRLVIADAGPQPKRVFQTEFDARGFQPRVARQFKRVNAIDQRYNEGKPAQPTEAQVTGAEWLEVYLLRGEGADAVRLPMTRARMTDMRCPSPEHVRVTPTDEARGGEKIDIWGKPKGQ